MKKLLTILIILLTFLVKGQDVKPTGANFKGLQSPSFSYFTTDSSVWIYKGAVYGWTKLVSQRYVQQTMDSLMFSSGTYEVEVTVDGVSTYTVPTTIKAKDRVYYNGNLLRSSLWSGVGSTSLVVDLDTKVKDYITIQF